MVGKLVMVLTDNLSFTVVSGPPGIAMADCLK